MAIRIAAGEEPIPGYRLIERLGGGGYGEVWKAEAPGGVLKAIKIVHGDLRAVDPASSQFAFQELDALKRVQKVRHPYLLSIDRYDVVEGRLFIVTELADGSLWDRYRAARKEGRPGLPREDLLRYLQEAAEVLDLMHSQHNLQHLDIKPQNLFLVHDHVKVADFGLVRDLHGIQAITTGGLTPTYAAPETFDGVLTRHCDQYSLAVVYQELLTGEGPFPGGSVQQIILQHLQSPPNLAPLPSGDRPAAARALAKRPEDRFPSCAAFVKALRDGEAAAARSAGDSSLMSIPGTSGYFAPVALAGAPAAGPPARVEPTAEGVLVPAVIVGLGQAGGAVLRQFRQRAQELFGPGDALPHLRLLYLDTDPEAAQAALDGPGALNAGEVLTARLSRAAHYLKPRPDGRSATESWLLSGVLSRLGRAPAAQGTRALGRLAFADHYRTIAGKLDADLAAAARPEALARAAAHTGLGVRGERPRVYLVTGLGGGSGGGMALDLAYLARHKLRRRGLPADVGGLLLLPPVTGDSAAAVLATANAYAALTELHHYSVPETTYQAYFDTADSAISTPEAPFARTTVLPLDAAAPAAAADLLVRELLTPFGRDLDARRTAASEDGPAAVGVRAFGLTRFTAPGRALLARASRRLALRLLDRWAATDATRQRNAVQTWIAEQWAAQELGPEPLSRKLAEALGAALGKSPEAAFAEVLRTAVVRTEAVARLEALVGRADGHGPAGQVADLLRPAAGQLVAEVGARMTQLAVCLIEQPDFRLPGAETAVALLRDHTERALVHYGPLSDNLLRKAAGAATRAHELLAAPAGRPTAAAELSAALEMFPKLRLQGLVLRQVAAVYGALRGQLTHALEEIALCRQQLTTAAAVLRAEDEQDAEAGGGAARPLLPDNCPTLDEAVKRLLAGVTREDRRAVDRRVQEQLQAESGGLAAVCLSQSGAPGRLAALVRAAAATFLAPRVGATDASAAFLDRYPGRSAAEALADAFAAAAPALGMIGAAEVCAAAVPGGAAAERVKALAAELVEPAGGIVTASPDDLAVYREQPRVPLGSLPQLGAEAREAFREVTRLSGLPPHNRADVVEWIGPR